MKKAISLLMALVMVLSLLPTALAAENGSYTVSEDTTPAVRTMEPLQEGNTVSASDFLESRHAFTLDGAVCYYRFGWNGDRDAGLGEWHLYATRDASAALDSLDGWTDCGAEGAPFTHYAQLSDPLPAAAALALRYDWENLNDDAASVIYDDLRDLYRLVAMLSLEVFDYTDAERAQAQSYLEGRIGMDAATARLVPPQNMSTEDMLQEYYQLSAGVRAALQKTCGIYLDGTDLFYNFTQLVFRTERSMDEQGGGQTDYFDRMTDAMRDAGFTAPSTDRVNFVFPEGLVRGQDYDYTYDTSTGDLRITLMKYEDGSHWIDAFRNMYATDGNLRVRVKITPEDNDVRADVRNGNGGFESLIDLTSVESNHISYMWDNDAQQEIRWVDGSAEIGIVNRVDGFASIVPTDRMGRHRFAVVWGDAQGQITHRQMVNVFISIDGDRFRLDTTYPVATPVAADRLQAALTMQVTDWTAAYEEGRIFLTPASDSQLGQSDTYLAQLALDSLAPAGYQLQRWIRSDDPAGSYSTDPFIHVWSWLNDSSRGFQADYEITWVSTSDASDVRLQTLSVMQGASVPYYALVGNGSITGSPAASLELDTAALANSGIHVTYDPTLGYFHASYDDQRIPDFGALVDTRIPLPVPEGAVTFTATHEDGNQDPRMGGTQMSNRTWSMLRSGRPYRVDDTSEEALRCRSLELVLPEMVGLAGLDICVSATNSYRSLVVAWWGADGDLVDVSYVYGQNDDFVYRTRTASAAALDDITDLDDNGEVRAPVAVGAENMELICSRYPQNGDGRSLYFELYLANDQGGVKTICLPYSYFGLSYQDIKDDLDNQPPVEVCHYDSDRQLLENGRFYGRYEPQGIVFETETFSPFLVSLGGSGGGFGDNIDGLDIADNGRIAVVNGLRLDDRDVVELGVNWREEAGEATRVGLPLPIVSALAENGRPVQLYTWCGTSLLLTPDVLAHMNASLTASDYSGDTIVWVVTDYVNCDGPNGKGHALRTCLYLGEDRYTLPAGSAYTFGTGADLTDDTDYVVYCPDDSNTSLEEQDIAVDCQKYSDDGYQFLTFSAGHDGMFVVAPRGYSLMQSWPWYGAEGDWTPSDEATVPDSAYPALQYLYDNGYKFPCIGKDFHLSFPRQLKEWTEGCGDDWDYRWRVDESRGLITVEINYGSKTRWDDAVRGSGSDQLADGVFLRYYFGNSDDRRPMTYGYDWQGDTIPDSFSGLDSTLYEGYCHNNGVHLATINRMSATSSLLTLSSKSSVWTCARSMSNEQTTADKAAVRYALCLEIHATEDRSYSVSMDNGDPAARDRLHVSVTHSDWTAITPSDGAVFLRTVSGKTMDEAGTDHGRIAALTADAPTAGYTLRCWTSSSTGDGGSFPVELTNDRFQTVRLYWQKAGAPDLLEYISVECQNSTEWFNLLPGTVTHPDELLDSAADTTLRGNGITVIYDPDTGYFSTSVDASQLTDPSLLTNCFTMPVPDGAARYKAIWPGGNGNPALSSQMDADSAVEMFSNIPETFSVSEPPTIDFMALRWLELDGLTVYYADSQMYRCLLVQWLDADGGILGYSYVYGRNGSLATAVDTACVDAAPTESVALPTLVGEDVTFFCDRNPQTGDDSRRLFLRLDVSDPDRFADTGAEIYLPYSYFDMTVEQGLALAAQQIRPLIRHYLSEDCTVKETLLGEYTAAGIRVVTRSFSPFLIDAGNTAAMGDLNGNGLRGVEDMQSLYTFLSTGSTTESAFADRDDFLAMADINGDGSVNILDYQYLYETVKAG